MLGDQVDKLVTDNEELRKQVNRHAVDMAMLQGKFGQLEKSYKSLEIRATHNADLASSVIAGLTDVAALVKDILERTHELKIKFREDASVKFRTLSQKDEESLKNIAKNFAPPAPPIKDDIDKDIEQLSKEPRPSTINNIIEWYEKNTGYVPEGYKKKD